MIKILTLLIVLLFNFYNLKSQTFVYNQNDSTQIYNREIKTIFIDKENFISLCEYKSINQSTNSETIFSKVISFNKIGNINWEYNLKDSSTNYKPFDFKLLENGELELVCLNYNNSINLTIFKPMKIIISKNGKLISSKFDSNFTNQGSLFYPQFIIDANENIPLFFTSKNKLMVNIFDKECKFIETKVLDTTLNLNYNVENVTYSEKFGFVVNLKYYNNNTFKTYNHLISLNNVFEPKWSNKFDLSDKIFYYQYLNPIIDNNGYINYFINAVVSNSNDSIHKSNLIYKKFDFKGNNILDSSYDINFTFLMQKVLFDPIQIPVFMGNNINFKDDNNKYSFAYWKANDFTNKNIMIWDSSSVNRVLMNAYFNNNEILISGRKDNALYFKFLSNTNSFVIEKNNADEINLFPNPTNSKISINTSNILFDKFEIWNLNGQKILSGDFSNLIDLKNFNSGTYIVQLINQHSIISKILKVQK